MAAVDKDRTVGRGGMMMENMLPIKVYVYENWEDYLNAKPTVNRN